MRVVRVVCLIVMGALLLPSAAAAQDKSSHWGARVSFTPNWELADNIRKVLYEEGELGTMKGKEFEIGFVRGSNLGGDAGVSFVRKPFSDESGVISRDQDCFNQAQTICRDHVETTQFQSVYLNAVEFNWSKPFHTFAQRIQVGMNVGAGIGSMKGNVVKITDRFEPTGFNQNGPTGFRPIHEVEVTPAKDELLPYFPMFKLEAEGAVIVAPGLKVKFAGGINFPATSFRMTFVYLIGAK